MTIKCNYEGCNETITGKDVLPEATFTCKNHTPAAEKDISFQDYQFDKDLKNQPAFNDFGTQGFQIITIEERASKETPDWAKSDEKIANLIRKVFPKFETNEKQRFRASRWVRIIYLHFRVNYTLSQIADEMYISEVNVKNILNRVRRVAAGRTASNTAERKNKS
jgi:hypothetical protein